MDYTELLKENERLKLQLQDYETRYKPIYDKHMQTVKEQALADYGLQADAVWIDRITADTEEGIAEQVKALAVDLRIERNNAPVDPVSRGNGARRMPQQTKPEDYGKQTYQRLQASGRLHKTVSSIKAESAPPVKAPISESRKGIIARWLGR